MTEWSVLEIEEWSKRSARRSFKRREIKQRRRHFRYIATGLTLLALFFTGMTLFANQDRLGERVCRPHNGVDALVAAEVSYDYVICGDGSRFRL